MSSLEVELRRVARVVDSFMLPQLTVKRPSKLWRAAAHLPRQGGKRVRPFLTINMCKALGGREEDAVPAAVAVELIQTFSLIHDDIIDNDWLRRGAPTVHRKWGIPTAIVAGDLLHAKAYDVLTEAARRSPKLLGVLPRVLSELNQGTISMCEGQQIDEELERTDKPTRSLYLKMIEKKTAALFELSTVIGAILGTGDERMIQRMRLFGRNLGIAFQIVDDILGLVAHESELGKPVGSDIREGKRTLLVIRALSTSPRRSKQVLMKALGNKKASRAQLRVATDLIIKSGAVDYAYAEARRFADAANSQQTSLPETREKTLLRDLVEFVMRRRY